MNPALVPNTKKDIYMLETGKLHLEVGKRYRTRSGLCAVVTEKLCASVFEGEVEGEKGYTVWDPNGIWCPGKESEYDLVQELESSAAPAPDQAKKNSAQKVKLDLLPVLPLIAVGRVLTKGGYKYDEHNWRAGKGLDRSYVLAAAFRHLLLYMAGEDLDEDTQENHLACILCEVMFALEYHLREYDNDDRYKYSPETLALLRTMIEKVEPYVPAAKAAG